MAFQKMLEDGINLEQISKYLNLNVDSKNKK